ncbi:hypothetical protein DSL72_002124 [Monilinia vaccinii-corymbosi]|uniref:Uncharacterized protein n=1 Tax=Monilinia vaccinii-corymbosi TaxID=61207 RepID=A0A8A3PBQ5_9HELO|nr:hypothetical protein DSL72_002124 [Monilinia vaccinii-corymbosi]
MIADLKQPGLLAWYLWYSTPIIDNGVADYGSKLDKAANLTRVTRKADCSIIRTEPIRCADFRGRRFCHAVGCFIIWAMTFFKVHPPQNSSVVWPDLPLEVRECGLYYCVNRYESKIANGTLSEEISELTSARRDPDSWQVTSSKWADVLNSSILSSLEFNNKLPAAPRSNLSLGKKYNVSQVAVNSISSYIGDLFSTNINITHDLTATQQARLNGYIMSDNNLQFKPSSMQAFNTSNDLPATFESLAKSMSNSIRANDDGGKLETATNHEMVTFYKIEWKWISLHCVFIIAAVVFTALTIYQTRMRGTPA